MKSRLLLLALFVYVPTSYSAGAEDLVPDYVGCQPNGICYIGVNPFATNTVCPNKSQIRIDISLPGSNAQYSAALSAVMSGKTINAHLADTCIDGYPTTGWLHVKK